MKLSQSVIIAMGDLEFLYFIKRDGIFQNFNISWIRFIVTLSILRSRKRRRPILILVHSKYIRFICKKGCPSGVEPERQAYFPASWLVGF